MTEFDRHLGAILGALKGLLLTLATTCALLIYFPQMRDIILKSESSSIASKLISRVYPILPNAMHTILDPYLKQLDQQLPIDLNDPGNGFQGLGSLGTPQAAPSFPSAPVVPTPPPAANQSIWRLEPTTPEESAVPVRKQVRSAIPHLEPTDSADSFEQQQQQQQPVKPRRTAMQPAPQDDFFEASDPDRVIGQPR